MLLLLMCGAKAGTHPPFGPGVSTVLTNKPAGPAYTRKRFDEFLDLIRKAQEAERKAEAIKQEKERLAAIAAAQEAQRVAEEARERQAIAHQEHIKLLQLRHAVDAFNSARTSAEQMRAARLMEMSSLAARTAFDDDEEAATLLMLH